MTVQKRGRPSHFISRNKRVRIWHRRIENTSNTRIIRISKLLTGIEDFNTEYDPEEVYNDLEQSTSDNNIEAKTIQEVPKLLTTFVSYATENNFDSIYTPCIASKQTRVVNQSKSMTEVKEKLEEVYVNLWGPHNLPLFFGKMWADNTRRKDSKNMGDVFTFERWVCRRFPDLAPKSREWE